MNRFSEINGPTNFKGNSNSDKSNSDLKTSNYRNMAPAMLSDYNIELSTDFYIHTEHNNSDNENNSDKNNISDNSDNRNTQRKGNGYQRKGTNSDRKRSNNSDKEKSNGQSRNTIDENSEEIRYG